MNQEKMPKLKYQKRYVQQMTTKYVLEAEGRELLNQRVPASDLHALVQKKTTSGRIVEAMDIYFKKGQLDLLKYYDNAFAQMTAYQETTKDSFGLFTWYNPELKEMFELKLEEFTQDSDVKEFKTLDTTGITKITKSEKYSNFITMAWIVGLKTSLELLLQK